MTSLAKWSSYVLGILAGLSRSLALTNLHYRDRLTGGGGGLTRCDDCNPEKRDAYPFALEHSFTHSCGKAAVRLCEISQMLTFAHTPGRRLHCRERIDRLIKCAQPQDVSWRPLFPSLLHGDVCSTNWHHIYWPLIRCAQEMLYYCCCQCCHSSLQVLPAAKIDGTL